MRIRSYSDDLWKASWKLGQRTTATVGGNECQIIELAGWTLDDEYAQLQ